MQEEPKKRIDAEKYKAETGQDTIHEGKETPSETLERAVAVMNRLQEQFEQSKQIDSKFNETKENVSSEGTEEIKKNFDDKFKDLQSQIETLLVDAVEELRVQRRDLGKWEKKSEGIRLVIKPLLDKIDSLEEMIKTFAPEIQELNKETVENALTSKKTHLYESKLGNHIVTDIENMIKIAQEKNTSVELDTGRGSTRNGIEFIVQPDDTVEIALVRFQKEELKKEIKENNKTGEGAIQYLQGELSRTEEKINEWIQAAKEEGETEKLKNWEVHLGRFKIATSELIQELRKEVPDVMNGNTEESKDLEKQKKIEQFYQEELRKSLSIHVKDFDKEYGVGNRLDSDNYIVKADGTKTNYKPSMLDYHAELKEAIKMSPQELRDAIKGEAEWMYGSK
jgi:hypothetical protein